MPPGHRSESMSTVKRPRRYIISAGVAIAAVIATWASQAAPSLRATPSLIWGVSAWLAAYARFAFTVGFHSGSPRAAARMAALNIAVKGQRREQSVPAAGHARRTYRLCGLVGTAAAAVMVAIDVTQATGVIHLGQLSSIMLTLLCLNVASEFLAAWRLGPDNDDADQAATLCGAAQRLEVARGRRPWGMTLLRMRRRLPSIADAPARF